MEYYGILNLDREPFSNSPDPDFFYPSGQHRGCLQQVELAIRLRRGLNVVLGDVGTGKTTICRDLVRRFGDDAAIEAHLMLDPGTSSPRAFLAAVLELLTGSVCPSDGLEDHQREAVKQCLFDKAVEQGRTVVLIVDEGQKLTPPCLEVLRELLNYETNTHKLLQIVIFAQKEFDHTLDAHPNFADRVNLRLELKPLGFRDTVAFIRHRIRRSGGGSVRLFSLPAMVAIFVTTRGYPRRIIHLCHRVLLALIIQNRGKAGWRLVRASVRRTAFQRPARPWRWAVPGGLMVMTAAFVLAAQGWLPALSLAPPGPSSVLPKSPAIAADDHPPRAPSLDGEPRRGGKTPPPRPPTAGQDGKSGRLAAVQSPAPALPAGPTEKTPAVPPARLGRLAIAPNETLGQLIKMVYGRFTPQHLEAVAAANPHIADPDTVSVGQIVHFPALPTAVRPPPVRVWWVRLSEHERLEDAVLGSRAFRKQGVPAKLLPYWNADQGLIFALVLAECFFDRGAAAQALRGSGSVTEDKGAVCTLYREDTVYYSDPFSSGPRRIANAS